MRTRVGKKIVAPGLHCRILFNVNQQRLRVTHNKLWDEIENLVHISREILPQMIREHFTIQPSVIAAFKFLVYKVNPLPDIQASLLSVA